MKLTVFFEGAFWVGVVEETVEGKLRAGRHVFGSEPKDGEILEFVNQHMLRLLTQLTPEVTMEHHQEKKINPKRLARQVAVEMKSKGVSTFAQQALQFEYEKRKKEKKLFNRNRLEERKKVIRELKTRKAKQKHRGR